MKRQSLPWLTLTAIGLVILCVSYVRKPEFACKNRPECTRELEQAASSNDIDTLRRILAMPLESYDIDADKGDVMTGAIAHDNPAMLDLILRAHADPGVAEQRPLRLALQHGDPRIVKMLLDAGAYPSVADEMDGFAPPAVIAFAKAYKPDQRYYGVYGLPLHKGSPQRIDE